MRRLLSHLCACWSYTSRRRGRTPVAIPAAPVAFSRLLSLRPIVGLGRCHCFAPARLFRFLEVK